MGRVARTGFRGVQGAFPKGEQGFLLGGGQPVEELARFGTAECQDFLIQGLSLWGEEKTSCPFVGGVGLAAQQPALLQPTKPHADGGRGQPQPGRHVLNVAAGVVGNPAQEHELRG